MSAIIAAPIWEAMRRDFTAISAFSMAISFVAAVVICLQISQVPTPSELQISGAALWAVEIALFGVAVYLWRRSVSLTGWILGIAGLVAVQLALTVCSAAGLMLTQTADEFGAALARASGPAARLCGSLFALMVFYPLRGLLPLRTFSPIVKRRFAESPTADPPAPDQPGEESMIVVGSDKDAIPVWTAPSKRRAAPSYEVAMPMPEVEGAVQVPLHILLSQIPQEFLGPRARKRDESHPVSIPMEVILPQLREARVAISLGDLDRYLPPNTLQASAESGPEGEAVVVQLPLELIVPQLPPEALELPPPSPPAWARTSTDIEPVVFATV